MSGSNALTRGEQTADRRRAPKALDGDRESRSQYAAEMDQHRPAYFSRLLRFLMRRGRSREDAEDLIQEAMLRLHVYAKDDVQHKEAFLRRAVRNLAIDRYRQDLSRIPLEVPLQDVDRLGPLIAPGPTPDQILDIQQQLDALAARLEADSPRTRRIYLAHRSGYTYAEIARHMGIAQITVKRQISRAKAVLMNGDDQLPLR